MERTHGRGVLYMWRGLRVEWYLRAAMRVTKPQAAGSGAGAAGWGGGAQVQDVEDSR
jgi:hypothetical protein